MAIEKKDIENLANLARLEIKEEEKESLRKDIDSILEYVADIKDVPKGDFKGDFSSQGFDNINEMRDDEDSDESAMYTDKIISEAPDSKDGYVKVKKIL